MKIVKGAKWLKRDFVEQLEQLFESNRVVELDKLDNFDGKEQFIKNMFVRGEIAIATESDTKQQVDLDQLRRVATLKERSYQDKLKQEEEELEAKINGKI